MDDKWVVLMCVSLFLVVGVTAISTDRRDENIRKEQIQGLTELSRIRVEAAKACNGNTECMDKIFKGVEVEGNNDR